MILMLSVVPAFAEDEVAVTVTYRSGNSNTQGQDNFYMCSFKGNEDIELTWSSGNQRWMNTSTLPCIKWDFMNPTVVEDVGFKFIAPTTGMVRLKGEATFPNPEAQKGNGVILSIQKGKKVLWKTGTTKKTEAYNMTIPVKAGEVLYFKANASGSEAYDWVYWWPTVEYLAMEYANDDKSTYYQKDASGEKQLEFNNDTFGYTAEDGTAFISTSDVFPTEQYSLLKKDVIEANGRYRLYATVNIPDVRSGGNIIKVYKNDEKIWEQLVAVGEEQIVDIGFWANKDDVITTEISVKEFTGYNHMEWECNVTRYIKPFVCEASTSVRHNTGIIKSYPLGSFVGSSQGANGSAFYTYKNDMVYPMTYNATEKKWKSTVPTDTGYISPTAVYPGSEWAVGGDSVMEFKLPESGIINLAGPLEVNAAGDGVLTKIYINDELIWSNRIGGDRVVRWDEPYDVCYFLNNVNATAKVEQGDVMKLTFNGWRRRNKDDVGIANININYVSENVISDTTRWKLDNSTVIDTVAKRVHKDGVYSNVDVILHNGTTYVAASDIQKVLGEAQSTASTNINGTEYIPLRAAAESCGKSVSWAADRMVLVYDTIPVFFGYPELSEIKTVLEIGGDLFE